METIKVLAISNRGRSRIGTHIVTAAIEQDLGDKLFLAFPFNQFRWVKKVGDLDFRLLPIEQNGTV